MLPSFLKLRRKILILICFRCEEFAARHCTVYATSRRVETIGEFKHSEVHKLPLDVNNDGDVQEVVDTIIRKEGRIDVLVNNAGIQGVSM